MDFDLVVRGGSVIDGSGAPPRTADVAIAEGQVVEVGRVRGRAAREIDADGALVTPGFVDIHTHYDDGQPAGPHRRLRRSGRPTGSRAGPSPRRTRAAGAGGR